MQTTVIVLHLPQAKVIAALFGGPERSVPEAFLIIGAVTALDYAVTPRTGFRNEGVEPPRLFDAAGKHGFALRVCRVLHRERHGVVGPHDKKGGEESKAR